MIHLGDKGYALNEYLITPLAHPNTDQERNFNSAHAHKGNCGAMYRPTQGQVDVHRSAGGTLLYSPENTCNIILACGVLHNIALANGVPFADLQPDDPMPRDPWPQAPHARALRRRVDLIRLF